MPTLISDIDSLLMSQVVGLPDEIRAARATVFHDVVWDDYEALCRKYDEEHVRMTYLDGTLIIMSPEYIHDNDAELLGLLVRAVAYAFGIAVAGARSTTFRLKGAGERQGSGKEPDSSFYVGANERKIRRKVTINLDVDPPPDLAIEVENKSDAEIALPVYARLGVPEVWLYQARDHELRFLRLAGDRYEDIDRSLCLPMLTRLLVLEVLAMIEDRDLSETECYGLLPEWAKTLPVPPVATDID